MSSFYGGRRGASFEIVKRYLTYGEMLADIRNIDYNQYVITEEGNNIYRKTSTGYDFVMSVDPSKISTSLAGSLSVNDFTVIEQLKSSTSYSEGTAQISDSTQSLIKYNSVVNDKGKTLMGFSFPAYMFDLELQENAAQTKLERIDDKTNPFYAKWLLSIANLIGRSFSNLRIVNSNTVTEIVYSSVDYTTEVTLPADTQVILYDITEEDQKIIYFGTFDSVQNIDISNTGLLTIDTLNKSLSYQFKDISDITFENGILSFTFVDGSSKEFNINYPTQISMNEEYSLFATYADGTEAKISEPINYILDTKIENDHLFIKFSDKTYKQEELVNGYVDCGSIKYDSGLLVGKNYTLEELGSSSFSVGNTISFLNTEYPSGLTGDNLNGKIVTVGNEGENKYFFAFDYVKGTWYFLSSIGNTSLTNLVAPYTPDNILVAETLPIGGIWFIEEV